MTPSSENDHSQAGFVIEQFVRQETFENDGSSVQDDQGRIKIQSEAGLKRYGLLTFSYASGTGTFEIGYVRVRKADGSVVETPADNVQDMASQITREAPFYSDLHEKHVAVKGLSVGDTLEYRIIKRTTKPLAPGQFWTSYRFTDDEIVLDEQLQIRVPHGRAIKLKSASIAPVITEEAAYRRYAWHHSHLQPSKAAQDKRKNTELLWQQERGLLPQPEILLSSFASWDEVGHWYGALQADRVKPGPEVTAKAAELTHNATTDEAKIRALYAFVSTQFRYIGVSFGIGRYQPHPAAEVLANQYGDCKDKHTLLASLLTASGIPAFPALISAHWDVDADVPSPGQFDHVITVVPRGNDLVWLDTTSEVGPYRFLVSPLRDKRALVIWADKPSILVGTPANPPFASIQDFTMQAKLNDAGTLEGHAEFVTRGDVEYVLREGFRSVPLGEWKDLVQRISFASGFGGEVSDVTASSAEKTDEPFRFSYAYTRKNYGDWDNRRISLPMPPIVINAPSDDDALPEGPTWLGPPSEVDSKTEIELPSGYHPQLPAPIHLKKDFARYDSTTEFTDGKLIGHRHLQTFVSEAPTSARDEVRQFSKALQDDWGVMISLTGLGSANAASSSTSPASLMSTLQNLPPSSNPEASRLEEEARSEIGQRNASNAISSLYRAVAADPKFTRAWVVLGSILLAQGQLDAGVDAFHKAGNTDPDEAAIPKALGFMLMASSHLEQATTVWQDFVKAHPDDPDGALNLAQCLLQSKQYTQSVAALEPAAAKNPARVDLQRLLASSYAQAGQGEKAGVIYRKLAEQNPRPDLLNDYAYELAEAHAQLPLALELAHKAAHSVEETANQTTLQALTMADLERVQGLAAIWDTVGWVYLRMSTFPQAEEYLRASWRLSQDGVVGAHLCELYDNEHKLAEAITTCRLAAARLPMAQMNLSTAGTLMQETQHRLDRLSAGKTPQNGLDGTSLAIRERTYKLPRFLPGTESAEFYVLLTSDGKSKQFKIQDEKFISGSDKMKSEGKQLHTIEYGFSSPSEAVTKIVRRGILGCYQYTGCSFVLLDPGSIRSLD